MKTFRFLLVLFLIIVAILSVTAWLMFRTPAISSNSVLVLDLQGDIPEHMPTSGIEAMFGEERLTMNTLNTALHYARSDKRVHGLLLRFKGVSMGFAKAQELRTLIREISESGKWTAAYLDTIGEFSPGNGLYYLASACDSITVNPLGDVNLIGLHAEVPFLRGTLDKLKIEPDMDHIREYKTAMNTFTEKEFTEAHREMMESLIQDIYGQMVEDIADARTLEPEVVRDIIDGGPYSAEEALEKKLIDRTMYWDEMKKWVDEQAGEDADWVSVPTYASSVSQKGDRIAVVYGMGAIHTGESSTSPFQSSPTMGSDSVAKLFRQVRKDDSIKAVVFRVDSPGGSAVASEIIRREVVLTKESKPVVVSMSDVAGSGGYWVSMSADSIIADPGTITGSIGVVVGKMNTRKFWGDLIGVTFGEVNAGKNADMYSSLHNFTEEQKAIRTKFMEDIYARFVKEVSTSRGLTEERVNEIGRGRVWTGQQALDLNLIDEIGGLWTAVEKAKELADIPEDKTVKLVVYPREKSFLEVLAHKDNDFAKVLTQLKQGDLVYGPVWCPVQFTIQ
ncbi:MAG TPA: signal peptide peptidase SppA [Thermoanaerobaculia bacterium]|nr:signal peptide peptidase SppA [Thermoanaerobaculia bacterium]HUM29332.1 signal peptide peptidase SppA [Thermoanaerobaculia bacterium]HXK67578.1 signal peptide peptidase SppA [Thermoanaerobaculia bacterium]